MSFGITNKSIACFSMMCTCCTRFYFNSWNLVCYSCMHQNGIQLTVVLVFNISQYFPYAGHISSPFSAESPFFLIMVMKCMCMQLEKVPVVQGEDLWLDKEMVMKERKWYMFLMMFLKERKQYMFCIMVFRQVSLCNENVFLDRWWYSELSRSEWWCKMSVTQG